MLYFDFDSLGENSGSPVFGKDYKIKGIHVGSGSTGMFWHKKKNKTQKTLKNQGVGWHRNITFCFF